MTGWRYISALDEINLHDLTTFAVVRVIGQDLPPPRLDHQPLVGGGADLAQVTYQPRVITLTLDVMGADLASLEVALRRLYRAISIESGIRPQLGTLVRQNAAGDERMINCGATAVRPTFRGPFTRRLALTFTAPHPNWYSEAAAEDAPLESDIRGASVPMIAPIVLGARTSAVGADITIDYVGSAPTLSLHVVIFGPALTPRIEHLGSGEFVEMDIEILDGETLDVAMGYAPSPPTSVLTAAGESDRFSVTHNGSNAIDTVTAESTPIILTPGANLVRYTHVGAAGADSVQFSHVDEFLEGI